MINEVTINDKLGVKPEILSSLSTKRSRYARGKNSGIEILAILKPEESVAVHLQNSM